MKFKVAILSLATGVAAAVSAAAEEEVYYCTSETAIGISKSDQIDTWQTLSFEDLRFRMKFTGDKIRRSERGVDYSLHEMVLSRDGYYQHFACSKEDTYYICPQIFGDPETVRSSFSERGFGGPVFNKASTVITDLKRFEYYNGSPFGFVLDDEDNSSLHVGTCETF
jgi:hypothetical protein